MLYMVRKISQLFKKYVPEVSVALLFSTHNIHLYGELEKIFKESKILLINKSSGVKSPDKNIKKTFL